jgi:small subunit ribosomal protein S6e
MVDFKVVLSNPATGKAYNVDTTGSAAGSLLGRHIGDEIDGTALGFEGFKLRITGASDRNGTPARKSLPIAGRRRVLVSGGVGFHPRLDGERRRKMIRGSEITADFVQINTVVSKEGSKPLASYFAPPETESGKE